YTVATKSRLAERAGLDPASYITASDRFQGGSVRPLRHPSKTPHASHQFFHRVTTPSDPGHHPHRLIAGSAIGATSTAESAPAQGARVLPESEPARPGARARLT